MAFYYQWPDDNATSTCVTSGSIGVNSGTEDLDYPAVNLIDGVFHAPAKLTTQSGSWVLSFPAETTVELVVIGPHNLDAGLSVKIQGHTTNAWTDPDLSVAITIPAARGDGRRPCPWVDLRNEPGFDAYQYWRLLVDGTNTDPVAIGELWLGGTARTLAPGIRWGLSVEWDFPLIRHVTEANIQSTYSLQGRTRTLKADAYVGDTHRGELEDWIANAHGAVHPMVIVPDSTKNDAWIGRLKPSWSSKWEFTDYNAIGIEFEEISTGWMF